MWKPCSERWCGGSERVLRRRRTTSSSAASSGRSRRSAATSCDHARSSLDGAAPH